MPRVELIMMSNFDPSAGGRETWAYNFIPALLASDPSLQLTIYGMRPENGEDNTKLLFEAIGRENSSRLELVFFDVTRRHLPYFFSMLAQLTQHASTRPAAPPDFTLGIGSVCELLMMLPSARFRRSRKIVWLRTILFNEKAERLSAPLLRLARRAERLLLAHANVLLANGDDITAHYAQYGLVSHVIKNGVDSHKWAMAPPVLGETINVGYIGRLSKVKGIETFLSLAREVKRSPDAARFAFHIIGDGQYSGVAAAQQAEGINVCHGPIDNAQMPSAVARLDVCVALTFASATLGGGGTSNALMEQMAAGRVIVAWDNIIFRQLLDETNSYLVAQGDVAGLSQALREIAEDPAAALTRAEAARSTIANYSIEAQVAKFRDVLKQLPG